MAHWADAADSSSLDGFGFDAVEEEEAAAEDDDEAAESGGIFSTGNFARGGPSELSSA